MSPDEQEALSLKHSFKTVLCLSLKSGRFALFNRAFKLISIVDNPNEMIDIIKASMYNDEPVPNRAPTANRKSSKAPTITLEELGL